MPVWIDFRRGIHLVALLLWAVALAGSVPMASPASQTKPLVPPLNRASVEILRLHPFEKTVLDSQGKIPDSATPCHGIIRLDDELLLATGADWNRHEVVLLDREGQRIPLDIRPAFINVPPPRPRVAVEKVSLQRYASTDNTAGFRLENPAGRPISAIHIGTEEKKFDKLLRIEASQDGENWRMVADRLPYFSFNPIADIAATTATFPAVTDRYLRVRVMDYRDGQPLHTRLNGGRLFCGQSAEMSRRLRLEGLTALTEDTAAAETTGSITMPRLRHQPVDPKIEVRSDRLTLTVSTGSLPVAGLQIHPGADDYWVQAEVFANMPQGRKIRIGSGPLYAFGADNFKQQLLPVEEIVAPSLDIVIDGQGGPPPEEWEVELLIPVYEAHFVGSAQPFRLIYGGAAEPDLDQPSPGGYEVLFHQQTFTLAPQQENPDYQPGGGNLIFWILGLALVGLTALLLRMLWQGYKMVQ